MAQFKGVTRKFLENAIAKLSLKHKELSRGGHESGQFPGRGESRGEKQEA